MKNYGNAHAGDLIGGVASRQTAADDMDRSHSAFKTNAPRPSSSLRRVRYRAFNRAEAPTQTFAPYQSGTRAAFPYERVRARGRPAPRRRAVCRFAPRETLSRAGRGT